MEAFSIVAHGAEIKHYLDSLEGILDVICLQETFLKESSIVNFPGHVLLRRDGKNGRGIFDQKRDFLFCF